MVEDTSEPAFEEKETKPKDAAAATVSSVPLGCETRSGELMFSLITDGDYDRRRNSGILRGWREGSQGQEAEEGRDYAQ